MVITRARVAQVRVTGGGLESRWSRNRSQRFDRVRDAVTADPEIAMTSLPRHVKKPSREQLGEMHTRRLRGYIGYACQFSCRPGTRIKESCQHRSSRWVGDECSSRGKRKFLIHTVRINLFERAYFIAT